MGGFCSRSAANADKEPTFGNSYVVDQNSVNSGFELNAQSKMVPPQVRESMEKEVQEVKGAEDVGDMFYDGIPRYERTASQKSRSLRTTQGAVAKVSEVGSRLGRAGTLGLGMAVEVLDTLGSSMTNLNPSSGFVSGAANKGSELEILAFEVANTIVKGSGLLHSLSETRIKHLKEVILPSDGVQHLISKDMDELLRTLAADKRDELKIFLREVVRFGNRCKDPQWHNLDRYFEKISRELAPQNLSREEAESVMQQMMSLIQYTAELYHELHALDRFEQDYQRKRQEDNSATTQKGDSLAILKAELKSQKKQVRHLKKKSLWSRCLEEVMEKLVDIVHYMLLEIYNNFGPDAVRLQHSSITEDGYEASNEAVTNYQTLGPAGLALHYANIIIQIDTLVARSSSIPPNTRDTLYQNLPPSIKSSLRSKLLSFHANEELTVSDIKAEMEKTLQWLVPVATNTAKAHHGFGWVGEWANTGSEMNQKAAGQCDVIRIDTLYHADKERTEFYILDLVLWLNHLVSKSKADIKFRGMNSPLKSLLHINKQNPTEQCSNDCSSVTTTWLTTEDHEMLQNVVNRRRSRRISKSLDLDSGNNMLRKYDRLSKSSSYSPTKVSKESRPFTRLSSGIPAIDFGIGKEKALDVIDRLNELT